MIGNSALFSNLETANDGLTNTNEYLYNITSQQHYAPRQKTAILSDGTLSIPITYLPNGTYWNGTIPNNDDTDHDGLHDGMKPGTTPISTMSLPPI